MATTTTTPKVWIGCLAAYNAGHLHGEWVDAAVEEDEIWEAQKRVLRTSPEPGAEEHFIADYEGFGPYRVGEYDSLATVAMVARLIEEHGVAFAGWLANDDSVLHSRGANGEYLTADESDLEEGFREAYRGEWDSEREFAENQIDELGLPGIGVVYKQTGGWAGEGYESAMDELSSYLDWETLTRDTMQDYWTHEEDGKVHVYSSN